jgi:hypothetical protein
MAKRQEQKGDYPRFPVVKRLFAVSGNRCAFLGCTSGLVDQESGKVIGKVCHIKGNRPGAARYDSNQSEQERQSFENLILMCGVHHDIIDADETMYTVDFLVQRKKDHEAACDGSVVDVEKIATPETIYDLTVGTYADVVHGSIINSRDQSGGQVADTINNQWSFSHDSRSDRLLSEQLDALRALIGLWFDMDPEISRPDAEWEDYVMGSVNSASTNRIALTEYLKGYGAQLPQEVYNLLVSSRDSFGSIQRTYQDYTDESTVLKTAETIIDNIKQSIELLREQTLKFGDSGSSEPAMS